MNIENWVNLALDRREAQLRQAVHVLLFAIASSLDLGKIMAMRGGILLSIRYQGDRFTKDIDFSTAKKYQEFNEEAFMEDLEESLLAAVNTLDYGLDCRIQSRKLNPPDPGGNFQTLQVTIGYAEKGTKAHARLLKLRSADVLRLDYSFNEQTHSIEDLEIGDGLIIPSYSLHDLVAEKYRAILQQKTRNRAREQDAYDLYCLFEIEPLSTEEDRMSVLESLRIKSESRKVTINRNSMDDDAIRDRSKQNFENLDAQIERDLPAFDEVFDRVRRYYRSLPW